MAALTDPAADSNRPPHLNGIYLITCICGTVDAASFLGLGHTFVELMTGNLVFLSFELGLVLHGQNVAITSYVVALATFALGAMAGADPADCGPRSAIARSDLSLNGSVSSQPC